MKSRLLGAAIALMFLTSPILNAAVFYCATGDVDCLIDAVNTANENGEDDTINLAEGTYTLTVVNYDGDGPNGLPSITSAIVIQGTDRDTTIIERAAAADVFRIFHIANTGFLTLDNLTIKGGATELGVDRRGLGGAILNAEGKVAVRGGSITGNVAGVGGGIFNSGLLTIYNTIIADNIADARGGGISNGNIDGPESGGTVVVTNSTIRKNTAGVGGGIFNKDDGELTIIESTLDRNEAVAAGGGGIDSDGFVTITNSTIARNTSVSDGGIDSSEMIITNSTVSGNVGSNVGGIDSRAVTLINTIVAGNTGSNVNDCVGSVESLGHNLLGDPIGCNIVLQGTDIVGDPGLEPFVDAEAPGNSYFPLQPTSLAIDAGNNDECPPTDQLGNPRSDGNGNGEAVCDVGAIEFQNISAPVGGSVTGMILQSIKCQNRETGQRVSVPLPDDGAWNCEAAGLLFDPGDRIGQRVTGIADGTGSVGGTATGVGGITARCDNKTTGKRVIIDLNGETTWDCEAAGLSVRTGDKIVQFVLGTADQVTPPPAVQIISIDIQNRVNLAKDDWISAAILTDSSFDALQVDIPTVRFGPDGAEVSRYRTEDVDGDSDIDLRMRFRLDETGIACGDMEATMTGSTLGGQQFTGTDSLTVICN